MRTGLIGHTGFVGSNLVRAVDFQERFNRSNVAALEGRFDLLVCAGVSAVKWLANRDPESDRAGIAALQAQLEKVTAREFVLISTIDVYVDPAAGGDEATPIDAQANHAYGRHRRELELWCAERFERLHIVRLPALFGPGLKKNALFDLLEDNDVAKINDQGVFQWYPLARLWDDITMARNEGLPVVNLFPEPLPMTDIIATCFPGARTGSDPASAVHYRVGTRHAECFGGRDGYVMDRERCLAAIAAFVADWPRHAPRTEAAAGG